MVTTGTLMAGGAFAAIVAAWSHVKSFMQQLSSVLIIRLHLDVMLSAAVAEYLISTYTPLPSGIIRVISNKFPIVGRSKWLIVPFHTWNTITIVRKGRIIMLATVSNGCITLYSLRFCVDFKKLVNEALDYVERKSGSPDIDTAESCDNTRFFIQSVIGVEKVYASSRDGIQGTDRTSETPTAEIRDGLWPTQLSKWGSFRYSTDQFISAGTTNNPFEGLYYNESVIHSIMDAENWLNNGDWFRERGIPWKRGWLLFGPGGTGKSSLAKASAMKLGIPIYQFFMSTLSDREFMREWKNMSTPCMALLEDFDSVFKLRENLTEHKSLTFDCVLNTISGVNSSDGVFLVVTTNNIQHIDPAMGVSVDGVSVSTRPGRLDTAIYLGYADTQCKLAIANRVLKDWPSAISEITASSGDMTPAQFQELCIQKAFEKMRESEGIVQCQFVQ